MEQKTYIPAKDHAGEQQRILCTFNGESVGTGFRAKITRKKPQQLGSGSIRIQDQDEEAFVVLKEPSSTEIIGELVIKSDQVDYALRPHRLVDEWITSGPKPQKIGQVEIFDKSTLSEKGKNYLRRIRNEVLRNKVAELLCKADNSQKRMKDMAVYATHTQPEYYILRSTVELRENRQWKAQEPKNTYFDASGVECNLENFLALIEQSKQDKKAKFIPLRELGMH